MQKVKLINGDEFQYEIKESHKVEKHFIKIELPFLGDDYQWIELKEGENIDQKISEYLRSRSQHIDAICKKYETVESVKIDNENLGADSIEDEKQ